jgi:hypothetical protein
MRKFCKKFGSNCSFWCDKHPGHSGLCENGIKYSKIPFLGNKDLANDDIVDYNQAITRMASKNHGRGYKAWQSAMYHIETMAQTVGKMIEWRNNYGTIMFSQKHYDEIIAKHNHKQSYIKMPDDEEGGDYQYSYGSGLMRGHSNVLLYQGFYHDAVIVGQGFLYEIRPIQKFVNPPIIT